MAERAKVAKNRKPTDGVSQYKKPIVVVRPGFNTWLPFRETKESNSRVRKAATFKNCLVINNSVVVVQNNINVDQLFH